MPVNIFGCTDANIFTTTANILVFGMESDEDELQMAAGSVHDTRITPDNNENILQYEATLDNNVDYADDYDWDKIFAQYGSSF